MTCDDSQTDAAPAETFGSQTGGGRWRAVSTDDVPLRDRAAFWSDFVCAHLVQAQCDPAMHTGGFHGHVQQSCVAGVSISQIRASGQQVVRTPAFLADANDDQFIVVVQRDGMGRMRQDGREVVLEPGDIALCSTSRIYELAFDGPFWQTVLIVDAEAVRRRAPGIDAVTAARLPCDPAAGHMLACLANSVAALPMSTPAVAEAGAVNGLLDTLMAFGVPDQRTRVAEPFRGAEIPEDLHVATLKHALDSLDQVVLVIDRNFRLVVSNASGDALLQQSTALRLVQGHIVVVGACRGTFEDALRRVTRGGQPESCALSKGPVDVIATISRLPASMSTRSSVSHAHCLVVVTTPGRQRIASVQQLMDVYALTPAEARLAHSLMRGATLKEFQQEQGVKESTARSQLKSLLNKTGVSRQQDLIRMLACVPSVRDR